MRPTTGADAVTRRRLRTPLTVAALLLAATAVVAVHDPHDGGYGVCPVLALTGRFCAGCGGLRAAHDLATLDVAGAWAMNPLLTVAMPLVALAVIVWTVRVATGRAPWHPPGWVWIVGGAVLVVFSVLRNVPALHPALGPA